MKKVERNSDDRSGIVFTRDLNGIFASLFMPLYALVVASLHKIRFMQDTPIGMFCRLKWPDAHNTASLQCCTNQLSIFLTPPSPRPVGAAPNSPSFQHFLINVFFRGRSFPIRSVSIQFRFSPVCLALFNLPLVFLFVFDALY